jgi:hypothetical protein
MFMILIFLSEVSEFSIINYAIFHGMYLKELITHVHTKSVPRYSQQLYSGMPKIVSHHTRISLNR